MCFVQGVVALTVLESLSFSNVIFIFLWLYCRADIGYLSLIQISILGNLIYETILFIFEIHEI